MRAVVRSWPCSPCSGCSICSTPSNPRNATTAQAKASIGLAPWLLAISLVMRYEMWTSCVALQQTLWRCFCQTCWPTMLQSLVGKLPSGNFLRRDAVVFDAAAVLLERHRNTALRMQGRTQTSWIPAQRLSTEIPSPKSPGLFPKPSRSLVTHLDATATFPARRPSSEQSSVGRAPRHLSYKDEK